MSVRTLYVCCMLLSRVQKNKNWLIIPSKAALKDRESQKIKNRNKSPRNYFSRVYPAATSSVLQPHLAPEATSWLLLSHLAPVVINWLLQLNIGSCSCILAPAAIFFAHAATSLLLQSHLNSWSHLLAPVAKSRLLELDLFCFFKSS